MDAGTSTLPSPSPSHTNRYSTRRSESGARSVLTFCSMAGLAAQRSLQAGFVNRAQQAGPPVALQCQTLRRGAAPRLPATALGAPLRPAPGLPSHRHRRRRRRCAPALTPMAALWELPSEVAGTLRAATAAAALLAVALSALPVLTGEAKERNERRFLQPSEGERAENVRWSVMAVLSCIPLVNPLVRRCCRVLRPLLPPPPHSFLHRATNTFRGPRPSPALRPRPGCLLRWTRRSRRACTGRWPPCMPYPTSRAGWRWTPLRWPCWPLAPRTCRWSAWRRRSRQR